jgi:hypothetical protein
MNLDVSTTYYYIVKAIDKTGESGPANIAYSMTSAG